MNHISAQSIAHKLISIHLPPNWTFCWDNARKRAGCCNHVKKRIQLSRHLILVMNESETRDTILHEIAHALVGPGNGHNWLWKVKATEIGANPTRCHNYDTSRGAKYYATCKCKTYYWHRKPKYTNYRCRKCKGSLIVENIRNKQNRTI